ncbi:MAG: protein-disulfide reductase DsbD [Candidatus Pelagadaptatus aseana]
MLATAQLPLQQGSSWGTQLFTDSDSANLSGSPKFLPVTEAYQLSAEFVDPQRLRITFEIAPGYYLYKHQIKARWQHHENLTLTLPTGVIKYDEIFEKELEVYYDLLEFEIEHQPASSLLNIGSQGCADAGLCYPPQNQQLEIDDGLIQLIASPLPSTAGADTNPASSAATTTASGLITALLTALLGGIILNLMPCVFPVLSLKTLSLLNSREASHQQHLHGWAYTLGCVVSFCLIAALMFSLREAGQMIGWGFQLQSPWVVASLSYLFVFLGVLLLGNFNLGGNLSGSGQSLTQRSGYSGSFFTGALATLVASPCTAPFMGAALGFAITQPLATGLLIFAALGFGMALPFLLLSYFPKLGQALPKPGPWMHTLKQFFAFPLFFSALWLLWVLGQQSGSEAVIAFTGGALAIAMGLWLWQSEPKSILKRILATLSLIAAVTPFQWLNHGPVTATAALDHNWQPFTQQRLDQLQQSGTPVFVNMTAAWCITCLANEKVALDTQASIAAFDRAGVVKLKGDWTNYNPEITQLLNRFGRNGVPLYLLYSGKPGQQPLILPQILTENLIEEALNRI